jgi:hypothetical protein
MPESIAVFERGFGISARKLVEERRAGGVKLLDMSCR